MIEIITHWTHEYVKVYLILFYHHKPRALNAYKILHGASSNRNETRTSQKVGVISINRLFCRLDSCARSSDVAQIVRRRTSRTAQTAAQGFRWDAPPSLTASAICRVFFHFNSSGLFPTHFSFIWHNRSSFPGSSCAEKAAENSSVRSANKSRGRPLCSPSAETDFRLIKTKRIWIKHRITDSDCASFGEGGRERGRQLFCILEALG